jgi:hypothetical protein
VHDIFERECTSNGREPPRLLLFLQLCRSALPQMTREAGAAAFQENSFSVLISMSISVGGSALYTGMAVL